MKTIEQIKVLKKVLFRLRVERILKKDTWGLCRMINRELNLPSYIFIKQEIPLFTRRNAMNFGDYRNQDYWWPIKDFKSRIRFVKWMIKELKSQQHGN